MRPARIELFVEMTRAGYTRKTLAAEIGRTGPYISNVLYGWSAPDTRDIERMAKVLSIPRERWLEVFFLPKGEPLPENIPQMKRERRTPV